MQSLLLLISIFFLVYLTHAAILKSPMTNDYPQIAVLGCDSRKANLYYDVDRRVWVEHLISSCVNNEQSILEFCQQAYPSLHIGNIVRLDTVLRFENWCELISPIDANGNNVHRCKKSNGLEEAVQPFRCLYMSSKREEITVPALDCSMNSIIGTGECFRPEKWQQLASIECANKSMSLNNSIMTLDWCGLSSFRGIEFVCCSSKKLNDNDYETSVDEQDDSPLVEDDPILEPSHRRIIAMTLATREPNWMEDYRRWNTDSAYFADDEDTNDYQASSMVKSDEHERFKKDKEDFKRKYQEQINQLKSRWQSRQTEIQSLSNQNATAAQRQSASSEIEFRREYDFLKQSASRERTRINEVHEIHLDTAVNAAKNEANQKLIDAWKEKPLKTETIQEALYKYLQALLRDRIQLVNRYERLRAVDPEQAERKRVSIHERLRFIVERINEALNQLRRHSNLQTKIQPRIDALFAEYDEVNQAAEKLLVSYAATSTVATKVRLLPPLGRDEKRIYPFSTSSSSTTSSAETNNEYDYATNDEYDEEEDEPERKSTSTRSPSTTAASTTTTTTAESEMINYDQVDTGDSDWDVQTDDDDDDDAAAAAATANKDTDSTLDLKIDEQNQQAFINEHDTRPLVPSKRLVRQLFVTYLPYLVGCLFILCILVGLLIFRFIRQNRSYRHKYEKNYLFTEVDSCSPEEKALHALQMNGYENPTYKFFESQTGKC